MAWYQREIFLPAKKRGFHLITNEILHNLPELKNIKTGILNVFIKHTSASLTINENADPSVRSDMEEFISRTIPDSISYFKHNYEGAEDMPSHIKSSLLGASLNIPVNNGQLCLGTWQGIYLCEHRNYGGSRKLVLTLWGE
jgi:secondary thiamine-phosphate synthase enzyme